MKYQTTVADLKRTASTFDRLVVGNVPKRPKNEVTARALCLDYLAKNGTSATFKFVSDNPDWKPSKYSERPDQVGFRADVEIPKGAADDHVVEVDFSEFRVERQKPKSTEWSGPSTREVLEAMIGEDRADLEGLPAGVEKNLKKHEEDGWDPYSWTLDGVEIRFEYSSSAYRGKTLFGEPEKKSIDKVSLQAGGYDRHTQIKRSMSKLEGRAHWDSELRHKFEECVDFQAERDQRRDAAEKRRKDEAKVRSDRKKAFKAKLKKEDLTSEAFKYTSTSDFTFDKLPNGKVEVDLKKFTPEQAAKIVAEIDAVVAWIESEASE